MGFLGKRRVLIRKFRYPTGMKPNDTYYECLGTPKNEDFTCSDSLSFELSKYETYISDHRHYFDHKVSLGLRWLEKLWEFLNLPALFLIPCAKKLKTDLKLAIFDLRDQKYNYFCLENKKI